MKNKYAVKYSTLVYFLYPIVILYTYIIFSIGFNNFNLALIWDSFFYSDFYFNYKSGFIRRGLDGAIIYYLASLTNFNPLILQKTINLISFVIFIFLAIRIIAKNRVIPVFYFFSTSCFLLYIEYILFGVRKDHLMILYFFVIIEIYKSKINPIFKYVFLNLISIVATLSHEVFFIVFIFPIILLFFYSSWKKIFVLVPSLIIFFLTLIFNGNAENKQVILESWHQLGIDNIRFNVGLFSYPIYIWRLGLTPLEYVGFILTLLCNLYFLIISLSLKIVITKKIVFFIIMQYLMCLSLCIVGCDFSRWIFFTNISIILTLMALPNIVHHSPSKIYTSKILLIIFFYFFINFPFVGWDYNSFINKIPIKMIYNFIFAF